MDEYLYTFIKCMLARWQLKALPLPYQEGTERVTEPNGKGSCIDDEMPSTT
jgi:hypothetical protein